MRGRTTEHALVEPALEHCAVVCHTVCRVCPACARGAFVTEQDDFLDRLVEVPESRMVWVGVCFHMGVLFGNVESKSDYA